MRQSRAHHHLVPRQRTTWHPAKGKRPAGWKPNGTQGDADHAAWRRRRASTPAAPRPSRAKLLGSGITVGVHVVCTPLKLDESGRVVSSLSKTRRGFSMVPPVPPPELKACNSNQAEVGEPPFGFYKKPGFKFGSRGTAICFL